MRKLLLFGTILLMGCGQELPTPGTLPVAPMAPSTSQNSNPDWHSDGKGPLPIVYWSGSVTNLLGKQSKFLVVDCLDANGKVLARDQIKCTMDAGKVLEMSNSMNVPADALPKIKKVVLTLI